ncbi:MAG TPA: protease pro-enzyme activation domain-containing protein, partial [Terracidiphilus sp.]|nr:protease pro-enzyme activation domain-containing protein [Terracidiphilus sp.]
MTRFMKSFALAVALLFSLATVSATAQSVKTHHVREAVRSGKAAFVSRMPANQTLQLDLVLPLRDPEGLKSFLADLYNPNNPNFRQFLTPQQFTARFGPTSDQYEAVLRFAKNYGLEVVGGSRDGMDVQVKASVAAIETAFHVSMRNYQHPTE